MNNRNLIITRHLNVAALQEDRCILPVIWKLSNGGRRIVLIAAQWQSQRATAAHQSHQHHCARLQIDIKSQVRQNRQLNKGKPALITSGTTFNPNYVKPFNDVVE